MTEYYVDEVYLNNTCFQSNGNITNVDCSNIPWTNNSMSAAFKICSNLSSITNINQNVTNMYQTFWNCSNLITAPEIPNGVTNLEQCFIRCTNISTVPTIPDSVISMRASFLGCSNIKECNTTFGTNITNMYDTFRDCTNMFGNLYIYSTEITNVYRCFLNTSLQKNVYIPFKYANNVNTQTYNTFNSAYGSGQNGVTLKDINSQRNVYIRASSEYNVPVNKVYFSFDSSGNPDMIHDVAGLTGYIPSTYTLLGTIEDGTYTISGTIDYFNNPELNGLAYFINQNKVGFAEYGYDWMIISESYTVSGDVYIDIYPENTVFGS